MMRWSWLALIESDGKLLISIEKRPTYSGETWAILRMGNKAN